MPELVKRFDLHPQIITKWKKEFVERPSEIFETKTPEAKFEAEKERLYAKIDQLEIEHDWLKKNSKRVGL